jgi:hypothetical protein
MSKALKKFKREIKKRIVSIPFDNGGILDLIVADTKPVTYTDKFDYKEFMKWANKHFLATEERNFQLRKELRERHNAEWEKLTENNNGQ